MKAAAYIKILIYFIQNYERKEEKMKKKLVTTLSVVLILGLAVLGILALNTDRANAVNTFTVGDVRIELNEEFEQGSELIPGVDISKDITVTNTGKNDAYVFYTYSVPTALISTEGKASKNVIHFNPHVLYWDYTYDDAKYLERYGLTAADAVDFSDTWHYQELIVDDFEKDGIMYTSAVYLYNGVINPGETTNTALDNVYLDRRIDIDPEGNMNWVENGVVTKLNWNVNEQGNPLIYVNAYAIQPEDIRDMNNDGKVDVTDAYMEYLKQWGGSLNGERGDAMDVVEVTSAEDIKEAIKEADGEPIIIDANGSDIGELDSATFADGSVVKDATISGASNYGNGANGTVVFEGCTFASTSSYAAHFDNGTDDSHIIFRDCTFKGWNSFGTAIKGLTFENCTFGHNGNYGCVRVYQDATFTNCTFLDTFEWLDTNVTGTTVNLVNCTGIDGKIYNNGDKEGVWIVDGNNISNTITTH